MRSTFNRKLLTVLLTLALLLSMIFSLSSVPAMAEETDLIDFIVNVESGRDVKVLQLTDPQIIDSDQMRTSDRLSSSEAKRWASDKKEEQYKQYIRRVVQKYNPDLIIITGDLVYGEFDDSGASMLDFVAFMDSFQIPWAPVFGNHENESAMGADWQCEQIENSQYGLFKQRTLTGNGNYTVGIKQDNTIKRVFFMVDSNGCGGMSSATRANGHSTTDQGFHSDQINWYTQQAGLIKAQYPNVKISFAFHIQPLVFADGFAKYGFPTNVPINLDALYEEGTFGYLGRKLKGGFDDSRSVWNGIKSLGADSIFVGHEHCNSGSTVYEGVRIQYGQKSSTYDRLNYLTPEGEIVNNIRTSGNIPLVGGTAIELDKTTGEIVNPHIVYDVEPPAPPTATPTPAPTEAPPATEVHDPEVFYPVSALSPTKVEGEGYTGCTVTPNIRVMNSPDDGQRAANFTSFTPQADKEYELSYYLKADMEGYYNLSAVASIRSQTYTSDWTMYVNTPSNAVSAYTQGADVTTTSYYKNIFKEFNCGSVYLNKGINTLYWKVNKNDLGADNTTLQAAIDYFVLSPPPVTAVSATEPTRIEGEQFTGSTHTSVKDGSFHDDVRGAKITNVDETTNTKYTVSYALYAAEAGYYHMTAAASLKGNSDLSEWTLYVNDSTNSPGSYTAANTKFKINGIGSNAGDVYDCGTVYLSQGANTLYWQFGKASGRDKLYAALDYVELTPPAAIAVAGTGTTRIEGEAYTGTTHMSVQTGALNTDATGVKITNIDETSSNRYTVFYRLNAEEAGYYNLKAAGSLKGNSDLSEWTVYVNDAENCPDSYTAANTKFRIYGIGDNAGDVYDCGTVYLSQGANTLYWQFGKASGRDKLYAAMDYFELTPVPVGIRRAAVLGGTFTAAIQKSHPLTASAHAFIAVYRDDLTGKLESINSVSIDSEEGEQEISLPLSVSNGNAVKILLWYDNTMQPLCKPVQISVIED